MTQICIVIQSEAFLSSAGMRVRYRRFAEAVSTSEVKFQTATVADLAAAREFEADVYLFSKTFIPEALVLAAYLRSIGKVVGHDFFDDYFSQIEDSRLARFRQWLSQALPLADFVICTTPAMQAALQPYLGGLSTTVVGDPVEAYDPLTVRHLLRTKLRAAISTRRLKACWFGIGDNPFFPVGVRDLTAQGAELARLTRLGWHVDLHVLTNVRALSGDGLARLRDLPLPFRVEEWTEEREGTALREAFLAFLPVSGQGFSRAKSLNRCLTSMLKGCQVLSRGYPLYEPLSPFIYRSADQLAADLDLGSPRHSAAALPAFTELVGTLADPHEGASVFVSTARATMAARSPADRRSPRKGGPPPFCLLHGTESNPAIHKLTTRLGGVSVSSPFQHRRLNFHARFDTVEGRLALRVARSHLDKLAPAIMEAAEPAGRILDQDFVEIPFGALGLSAPGSVAAVGAGDRASKLAAYPAIMRLMKHACSRLFPSTAIIVGEQDELALAAMATEHLPANGPQEEATAS